MGIDAAALLLDVTLAATVVALGWRCMITAGNGINGDCPLASLEAFLEESFTFGTKIVAT